MKKGISLIVLVITIIVIIIMTSTLIISLGNSEIINKANQAVVDSNLQQIQHIATLAWSEAYIESMDELNEEKRLETLRESVDKSLENIDVSKYDIKVDLKGVSVSQRIIPGLYDDNDNLVASWDELIHTYGVDFEVVRYYPGAYASTALGTIINSNSELQIATKLIVARDWDSIPAFAFENCNTLKNIIIPESVIAINQYAFSNCGKLENLNIPSSITYVGDNVFDGCRSLRYNEYDNAIYYGNTVNPYHILISSKNDEIISCEINRNTKIIMSGAFADCRHLTNINIPNRVIMIGREAFAGCSSLISVDIPDSVKVLEYAVFNNCISLTTVELPDSIEIIDLQSFFCCTSLITIKIPDSIEIMAAVCFYGCASLESIEIPNSVTFIGMNVFEQCTALKTIRFKGTVEEWNKIEKDGWWNNDMPATEVVCSNGSVVLK